MDGVSWIVGDATKMEGWSDESTDIVFDKGTLDALMDSVHVSGVRALLNTACRLLKRG